MKYLKKRNIGQQCATWEGPEFVDVEHVPGQEECISDLGYSVLQRGGVIVLVILL